MPVFHTALKTRLSEQIVKYLKSNGKLVIEYTVRSSPVITCKSPEFPAAKFKINASVLTINNPLTPCILFKNYFNFPRLQPVRHVSFSLR